MKKLTNLLSSILIASSLSSIPNSYGQENTPLRENCNYLSKEISDTKDKISVLNIRMKLATSNIKDNYELHLLSIDQDLENMSRELNRLDYLITKSKEYKCIL